MKNHFKNYKIGFLFFLLLLVGCGSNSTSNAQPPINKNIQIDAKSFPSLPSAKKIEDGVIVYEVKLNEGNATNSVWIYLPEKTKTQKIPCVLVTSGGGYLFNGTSLGEDSRPEHLPYVRAGYAVIAYETDGSLAGVSGKPTNEQFYQAARAFQSANAGLVNEKIALDYALDKVSAIDADRIYIAGHSSAATHSLLVAANEPRVKASIAYAPATDLEKDLEGIFPSFEKPVPGFKDFIARTSPHNFVQKIKCPVFIFQATDDSIVSPADTETFVNELKKYNPNVTFATVDKGNHYNSMIQQGIPKGIEWLNKISLKDKMK